MSDWPCPFCGGPHTVADWHRSADYAGEGHAINCRIRVAANALLETIPYMHGVAIDVSNSPWRRETAEGILARVRGALEALRG